ncbi:SusC/RagA family TonB-linked outer membrane protein [Pedobacter heparinus]|uniref:TonB-dependent receptor plug n=1 Tax=Pedobacter heparinus (strain ATCC 13125 / DSM 2366 / CIP 104194 / JCM 7457 / NBRC 12017 / NCIMB 9290 / NRRL B-14731 / HIM 762-3) TaxID=485917 RepID=C6XWB2_PEDHD|nr:SusC/RagA family TonB-linked outer membrane protein [Pedobacter heparinus]ACU04191.1 TonB-dependent receptor plug [Pedobacter heparinus DSM 2366]
MNFYNQIGCGPSDRYLIQILRIMKFTTFIIAITLVHVSAAGKAQISLDKKNVPIKEVFKSITAQTGYDILYSDRTLNDTEKISITANNEPLKTVLDRCLKGQLLEYELGNKTVIIKKRKALLLDKVIDFFTRIDVRGRVVDENNQPLVGAVIKIKDGLSTTSTNSNGEFLLKKVAEDATLTISFLGYETREIKAAENISIIKLTPSTDKLEEVEINAGYYTVTDKERTGSISRISSKEIEKQPINNVLQVMQATVPGLQVIQNTGVPGGGFSVRIRGQNSLTQGNEPFYIIDGVPFTATSLAPPVGVITPNASPLANINPADIENIEVLKDADATAIYGSRGANGVILITTKRGKAGKSSVSFSANQGISKVGRKLKLMNTQQYIEMRKEAKGNDNLAISTTDYDINGTWDQNRYTDWQDELIGGSAPTTNILASLSGGAGNITYLIGGNFYSEGTVYPGDQTYKRSSGNFSLQYTSDNQKFDSSFDVNYSQINSNLFLNDLTPFIRLPPHYPSLLTDEGIINWGDNTMGSNPLAQLQKPYEAKTNNLIASAALNYKIIPDLKLKARFGYTIMDRKEFNSQPLSTYNPANSPGPEQRISKFSNNSTNNWTFESQVDYTRKIGNGKFNALLGVTFQQGVLDGQIVEGSGYNSDVLMRNIAAASVYSASASYSKYRYMALFGRINYNLKDKYIINLTGRRDGSSRFGSNNRFANFGAAGIAWIVSEEDFIKEHLPFVSFAKLRGSFGITGNDQISAYGYLELWKPLSGSYQGVTTMFPGNIANPDYAWEVNKKAEAAFDVGLLNNRINLSLSYYSNRSSNQLVSVQLPYITGFSGITDNLDATIGNTGWEFEFMTKNISTKSFQWSTSFNFTIPKNKLIEFPNLEKSTYANQYVIGEPLAIQKLYKTSVNAQTGLYAAEDFDKNGLIDIKDRYVVTFTGRKYYGGLQNSFTYKGFALDVLCQFVKQAGAGYLNGFSTAGSFATGIPTRNQPDFVLNRWRTQDDPAPYQKYSTLTAASNSQLDATSRGSYAIDNASFIRLKNISLSYNLSEKLIQKIKLNSAKVFFQGQNLFTITPYKGLDPETSSINNLPTLQVFTVGMQLTF